MGTDENFVIASHVQDIRHWRTSVRDFMVQENKGKGTIERD